MSVRQLPVQQLPMPPVPTKSVSQEQVITVTVMVSGVVCIAMNVLWVDNIAYSE
jgi:hypothetical protein